MADPIDRVGMIILERDMVAKKTLNAKAVEKARPTFGVKSAAPRPADLYSGEPGNRARIETAMVDVKQAWASGDIEIRCLMPNEAEAFRIGGECTTEIHA